MKAFILIVTMAALSDNPTVSMQKFESEAACIDAVKAVTSRCEILNIDGGQHEVCYSLQNIEATCVKAK